MSDEIDRAQEIQLLQTQDAISKHSRRAAIAQAEDCIDCGIEIPAARAAAVACERCVDCQEAHEKSLRLIGKR